MTKICKIASEYKYTKAIGDALVMPFVSQTNPLVLSKMQIHCRKGTNTLTRLSKVATRFTRQYAANHIQGIIIV